MNETSEQTQGGAEPRHPIRVVSNRTGLTPSALRAWERRYGVVDPGRSEGGQRLYSDEDIERLVLLKRATEGGRSISKVAELPASELEALLEEDEAARLDVWTRAGGGLQAPPPQAEPLLHAAMSQVESMDPEGLESTLKRAVVTLGAVAFTDAFLAPFLEEIGERWAAGILSPAHEHAASAVVRRVLSWLTDPVGDPDAPGIVVATLPGELHDLGAMLASATASLAGWNVTYLGADLPPGDIASAARTVGARFVGISTVTPPDLEQVASDVLSLRNLLGPETEILVGGAAVGDVLEGGGGRGVRPVATLAELRQALAEATRS